ncbi:MAG: hypothetical protein V4598_03440 [Bdellovibrionota bacterium]
MKSSSRAGRFKKKLVSHDELQLESPKIVAALAPILELHRQKSITDAELAGLYVILYLSTRSPGTWLGAKRPDLNLRHDMQFPVKNIPLTFEENIKKRLPETLGELFNQFALKSTPESVNRSLLSWSAGTYPLILMFHIPQPAEVLDQQKIGKRCVTVMTKGLDKFILGERDPLSFTMHDLIHADHFYHDNHCFEGQISLYWFLDHCMKEGLFSELMDNEDFKWELEYLISDMNAYAIHSLKCLKAALIHYHPDKDIYFERWVNKLGIAQEHFLRLGTSAYSDVNEDHILLDAMKGFRQ